MLAAADSPSSTDPLAGEHWATWLSAIIPGHCTAPFAAHHRDFWEWVDRIEADTKPDDTFVGIWARGGAKSTSAEAAVAKLGAQHRRRYCWYVSGTQALADRHVENIGAMLESDRFELFYPEMAQRAVGKYGSSRGWRRSRLHTASGFVVDAVGLDGGARGVKVEDQRPDLIVIDDVDDTHDTTDTTRKNIDTLTRKILPAGAPDVTVIAIQNLVQPHSIFARLADGRADFLAARHVSGPIPAVIGLRTEAELRDGQIRHRVVGGEPTWAGQNLETVQHQIDDWGLSAFTAEAQHDVTKVEGALWCREQIEAQRVDDADIVPLLKMMDTFVTAVDPAATSGPDADDTGIIVVARTKRTDCPICGQVEAPHAFVFADRTCHLAPHGWGQVVARTHDEFSCSATVVESNQGGEMAAETITNVSPGIEVVRVHAKGDKRTRASAMSALYGSLDDPSSWELGRVHHVGEFVELEEQMTSWRMGQDSPDRLDALVHGITFLDLEHPARKMRFVGAA